MNKSLTTIIILAVIMLGGYLVYYQLTSDETDTTKVNGSTSNANVAANVNSNSNTNVNTTAETKESCEAQGGKWGRVGLFPEPKCNLPTSDGGNSCKNYTDCQAGFCIVNLTTEEAELLETVGQVNTSGMCPEYMLVVGCYNTIKDGVVTDEVLCID